MKCVFAVGALPAPLTPLFESATMPWSRSTSPAATRGRDRKNHRSGIASRVGDDRSSRNSGSMQLRHAVDGLGLDFGGDGRAFILEFVNGAVCGVYEPPRAAQVDNPQTARERLGNPLA